MGIEEKTEIIKREIKRMFEGKKLSEVNEFSDYVKGYDVWFDGKMGGVCIRVDLELRVNEKPSGVFSHVVCVSQNVIMKMDEIDLWELAYNIVLHVESKMCWEWNVPLC
ncbi:hypothetical protein [Pyrococcus horikoshii]|nr:hypothetical protein [Pyrococcus horikoshii]HII61676.1 hypothetical protein [Pyrococcus horikoshii]